MREQKVNLSICEGMNIRRVRAGLREKQFIVKEGRQSPWVQMQGRC